MDDPPLVRSIERVGDLPRHGQRVFERNGAARQPLGERLAVDELHHQRARAALLLDAIDLRDVRMVQRRQGPGLAFEPGSALGIRGKGVGQDLDGDIAIEPRVARAIHLSHAAFADLGGHHVRADTSTRIQGQRVSVC